MQAIQKRFWTFQNEKTGTVESLYSQETQRELHESEVVFFSQGELKLILARQL